MLTPAISVVSSIEGVQVSFPSVSRGQAHLQCGLPAAGLTLHCSCHPWQVVSRQHVVPCLGNEQPNWVHGVARAHAHDQAVTEAA